jgi:hypothetical protein
MTEAAHEQAPSENLNATNFCDFAARAVASYQKKRMTSDAVFWEDVVVQYDKALISKKPVSHACTEAVERRMKHYQVKGRILDLLLWSSILGHYNAAIEKARAEARK